MKFLRHATLLLAIATFASAASAADLSAKDKTFVSKAAQGGMTEVALGKIAEKNAASADVKAFGAMMVTDHTKAGDELKAVAAKIGATVPAKLNKKHQEMVDEMTSMSGAAFDKHYVAGMVKDHEKTIADFEMEAKDGENADLKAFAEKTLPTLKMHLEKIQAIAKSM